jgi:hypothetical protein
MSDIDLFKSVAREMLISASMIKNLEQNNFSDELSLNDCLFYFIPDNICISNNENLKKIYRNTNACCIGKRFIYGVKLTDNDYELLINFDCQCLHIEYTKITDEELNEIIELLFTRNINIHDINENDINLANLEFYENRIAELKIMRQFENFQLN